MGVERGLHIGGEGRSARRDAVRDDDQRFARQDEALLVRVQREDGAAAQIGRAGFDKSHGAIAVLHREREIAVLEGRAHALAFALRDAALADEFFGAAADAAVERPDDAILGARGGQVYGVQRAFTLCDIPERP